MKPTQRHYPDWKAPSEDGAIVIWPDPATLLRETIENRNRLSSAHQVRLQNLSLPQVRRRMRAFIGLEDDAQPLVAMGHQTELFHAGVWVKNVLINSAAAKLKGRALHIAVDSDAPKHLTVRWPGESIPISDDPAITSAAWSGLLAPPTPAHIEQIQTKLRNASANWSFQPVLPEVLASLRRLSLESLNLSAALTNATHELDWNLGLRHHALLASPIWSSEPFLVFVHDLLAHADSIASHYNSALDSYRVAHGVRSRMRPMPDLFVGEDSIEIPFWLDDLHSGKRTRPSVFKSDRGWILELVGGEEFVFEKQVDGWEAASRLQRWLSRSRHRIAPRALTLTMFFRLLMVDQFCHGIGGGRYDQVTDQLIDAHYGIEPPKFSVTTATMIFPEAVGRSRVCVPCVKQEGHRLRHELLGARKRELVAQIAALPRRSSERSTRFFQMHNELRAAAARSELLDRWERKLREAVEQEQREQTLFDRELFYAIQPRERLLDMIGRYASEFT